MHGASHEQLGAAKIHIHMPEPTDTSRCDRLETHLNDVHGKKDKQNALKKKSSNLLLIFERLEQATWLAQSRDTHKTLDVIA